MKYDDFVGKVQNRIRAGTTGEAVRAIRATLETLGERLYGGEAKDLASQLPQEIGTYLTMRPINQTFGVREFFDRVAEREGIDLPEATYHARVVMEVMQEAVTPGEIDDVLAQLPDDYRPLFEAGSEGEMTIS